MIISVVGAFDREAIQSFLNPLLKTGGVTEIRLLQMGPATYFEDLVSELKLIHDSDAIHSVNMDKLLLLDGKTPEMVIFMNTSYENFDNFCKIAFPLLKIIFDKLSGLEFNTIKFLFGDNYRGLVQHAYLNGLMKVNKYDPNKLQMATASSVFEISKILNSSVSPAFFRCYPKANFEVFVYEAGGEASEEEESDLTKEVEDKVALISKMFTRKSATSYPNIEGSTLSKIVSVYIQSKNWDTALRDHGLASRVPTNKEISDYGLHSDVALFLPPDDADRLPEEVKKHIQDASLFVATRINVVGD